MADSRLAALVEQLHATAPHRAIATGRPEAAVAVILAPDPDRLLVIRRAERAGDPWSGHLALPGGRREPHDASLLATAIRETREEIGVTLGPEQLIAELDDLVPSTATLPPLLVRPFVFVLEVAPETGLSDEVVQVAWISLATLSDPAVRLEAEVAVQNGTRRVNGYQLAQGFLWGMTDRILTPLVDRWRALG